MALSLFSQLHSQLTHIDTLVLTAQQPDAKKKTLGLKLQYFRHMGRILLMPSQVVFADASIEKCIIKFAWAFTCNCPAAKYTKLVFFSPSVVMGLERGMH